MLNRKALLILLISLCGFGVMSFAQEGSLQEALEEYHLQHPPGKSKQMEIYILRLENGEATVIISPSGFVTLIDGGAINDAGRVTGFLRSKNLYKIDLMLAASPVSEYSDACFKILQGSMCVDYVGLNPELAYKKNYMDIAEENAISGAFVMEPGEKYDLGGKASLKCVYVDGDTEDGYVGGYRNENKSACFILKYNNFEYFTGGAITQYQVRKITEVLSDVDVMKLNFTGASDDYLEETIQSLKPEFALAIYNDKHLDDFPDYTEVIDYLDKKGIIMINNNKPSQTSFSASHPTGLVFNKGPIVIKVPKGKKYFINDLAVMKDKKAPKKNAAPTGKFTVTPGAGENTLLLNPAGTKDSNGIQRIYWVVGDENPTGMSVGVKQHTYKYSMPSNVTSREVQVKMFAFDKMGKGTSVSQKYTLSKYKYKLKLSRSSYEVRAWSNFYVDVQVVDHSGRPVPNCYVKADAFFILWGTSDEGYTDSNGHVRMNLYANTGIAGETYWVNVKAVEGSKVVAKGQTSIKIVN